ncbi:helix-turn-helix domain-containing protein [Vallitalea guaymasensis]|uniref:Helix-turn-helix transcriptional regulator n=1 Tax=Vallitalea guaymasensis TaxID=1185412 RepID=A0A8J8M8F8_9FIRM|nr:helix-turn-helix transcriptional regulator [Vallitalea guaymasensis]QUH28281.1 helix-turn-helix transcriptional regulator [Vallitalea guaymasensis]
MLPQRLKILRKQNNWTQLVTATKLNIPRGTYAHYEIGKRQPDYGTLSNIADLYNVSIDYLIGRTDNCTPIGQVKKTKGIDEQINDLLKQLEENTTLNNSSLDEETKRILIKMLNTTKEIVQNTNKRNNNRFI